ncbi:hypothetical protein ACIBTV_04610 [Micromonospora sp. NPDC049366]|uniref:hypothetical protein n=1 Tax=Micromonospora sp. NPDC049366 TaxID=3364271 RepID=UPI0037A14E5D
MSNEPRPLRRRWAVLGPPVATAAMFVLLLVISTVRGSDTALWMRPAMLAFGGPMVLVWWQVVVRPRSPH